MKFLKNKTWLTAILTIIFILFLLISFRFIKNGKYETFEVKSNDFTQTVTVSGKVVPTQEINLGFEISGEISNVFVKIGDVVKKGQILASLNQAELSSEINESTSLLQSEFAKLVELAGTSESKEAESQLKNKKIEMLNTLNKAQITADNIIRNQVDTFFENPTKNFPEFSISLRNYFLRQNINDKRVEMEKTLAEWSTYNNELNFDNISVLDAEYNIRALKKVEEILSLISTGTTDFNPTSEINQAQIDSYIATISQAISTVSNLILEVNQITEATRKTEAEIPIQEAKVRNAQATVSKFNSRSEKYVIRAPFDGIVTAKEIEIGGISEIGKTAISMIENSDYEVEIFIPEMRISGINVGDEANVKLDAFGKDTIFKAVLSHIDPRETEKDGITTYRGLINFVDKNKDVRIGMTAEVEIEKEKIRDVITIPLHFILEKEGKNYVEILNGSLSEREIIVGEKDGKGSVLIENGLNVGDKIVIR